MKTLSFNAKALAARLQGHGDVAQQFSEVCIDSRQVVPGALFFAIRGERFDGHDFIHEAVARGARGVVHTEAVDVDVEQWYVADTLAALTDLARVYRTLCPCPTIAVTGSNGKTSVKSMIASILPLPSFSTPGNLNNHIGVPLSVLKLTPEHRYAVFELGANHVGEIKHTVSLVQPDVALINNIAPAHLEGFGDISGVVRAKSEIYQGLAVGKIAVVNEDDAQAAQFSAALTGKQVIGFSQQHATTIHATQITLSQTGCARFTLMTPSEQATVQLQVPGRHHVSNALAAASCTYALGLPLAMIVQGLEAFAGVSGRLTFYPGRHQAVIIDDTYNANLRSTLSAIDVLAQCSGKRILVLGDLGELGDQTATHHHELGVMARQKGIEQLFTCGQYSRASADAFGAHAQHYEHQQALVYDLMTQLDAETTILVKGSRSAAMENVVKHLIEK